MPPPPARAGRAAPAPVRAGSVPPGRLVGIDLARGLAVFGMFAVHVGPDPAVGGPVGFLLEAASGRSSALFALLAGFSLIIITGRPGPRTGRAGRQAVATVVIRAVVLLALGYALTALGTEVDVILSYYGVLFLAVLPLYRLRAGTLALLAAVTALALPQALYGIRAAVADGGWADAITAHDPLALLTGTGGTMDLLFTGDYPVLTWIPFLLAGMALARLDLHRPHARSRLALTGGALALLGYGGSWLALRLVPHALPALASATHSPASSPWWWSDTAGEPGGRPPPAWLLVAVPHSETTLSVVGGTGVAVAVVAACLTVAERTPRLARAAGPVAAVGMMALTSYVLHILALWFFDDVWYVPAIDGDGMSALAVLAVLIAATMLLATAWTRRFRRGPMEQLLHLLTRPARSVG
ncbi:DUF418 domain-containing protein [Streptomyces sp. HF10]|uniref:DUF418 domain-containing protein n=1 Tax=Streptomyces sp. HF10 TaxID=2692233 RepID=UPI001316AC76|nr:DUF418 domain-containing protein [Streptomyces sp. HF10]QHC32979.1 DUF418 domain-containing protein [Streptomyces sp. HF10]